MSGLAGWLCLSVLFPGDPPPEGGREVLSLAGPWEFRVEGAVDWRSTSLPTTHEQCAGVDFDGVIEYRRTLPARALRSRPRVLLEVLAAATATQVWCNGQLVGEHLGGWTPFRVDLTAALAHRGADADEILLRIDEKVGHNSQGFLPIIAPHFGGPWQEVRLISCGRTWIDDLRLAARGDLEQSALLLELPIAGDALPASCLLRSRHRRLGTEEWSEHEEVLEAAATDLIAVAIAVDDPRAWSPEDPALYEVVVELRDAAGTTLLDRVEARAAFRDLRVQGDSILLSGQPLRVRGLLNWGYAPPRLAPAIDEAAFRHELEFARACGFNLMKFCLWIPPRRYLERADEMGMLAWVEYPTWHSSWSEEQLPTLEREFREFFAFDRNHPSVVLRSLTCETGPSADIEVIRSLYDLCHEMIPGSIVEDDSSWIGWNRVHDFYDDHPYGNNHTWVATLARLRDHIAAHGTKPLVLGEAIAADTWVDPGAFPAAPPTPAEFWWPRFLAGNQAWQMRMARSVGPMGLEQLGADSRRSAALMRKYQIETFCREVPNGGYVVSVVRDFPLAGMGLLDYHGEPKWPASDWAWHGDEMLLLATPGDTRSFRSGDVLEAEILVHPTGPGPAGATLRVELRARGDDAGEWPAAAPRLVAVTAEGRGTLSIPLPVVDGPRGVVLRAEGRGHAGVIVNEWPLWVLPPVPPARSGLEPPRARVRRHASLSVEGLPVAIQQLPVHEAGASSDVVLAARFDRALLQFLSAGGKVLLLPDGEPGSLPLAPHWFLRGGPYVPGHALGRRIPRQLLVELQHFDLADRVVPDCAFEGEIDPILMLWDNHDIAHVRTHGLVFATQVNRGQLLVSALQHRGGHNAAGHWLLDVFVEALAEGLAGRRGLSPATIEGMARKVDERKQDLTDGAWWFRPDPEDRGKAEGWQVAPASAETGWSQISTGRSWESEGFPALDGWAWYRRSVELRDWGDRELHVHIEGADDYYELFVNGEWAGTGGDLERRITAYEEARSHDATRLVGSEGRIEIAVRVYDWYGAGGLHRPIFVSSHPRGEHPDFLR